LEPTEEDALPGGTTPFEDSSILDLDDPNITGSLLASFGDSGLPLLDTASVALEDAPAPLEDSDSSFAQLWAATLTDAGALAHSAEPQHHAGDHFSAWQKAVERHQLPTAVELLPPARPPADEEKEVSAAPPTGFFSTEDAPLFFVDEQWAPDASLYPEHVSQNPFEESVAVLNELSFQNALPTELPSEGLFSTAEGPEPLFPALAFHSSYYPEASDAAFYPSNAAAFYSDSDAAVYSGSAIAFHPDADAAFHSDDDAAFSEGDSAAVLSSATWLQDSPPELQNSLWLMDVSDEESQEEIILLEDALPPEEEEEALPAPVDVYNLNAVSAKSFPPKIPPVLAAGTPSLLTPAIFYDLAETPWSPPQSTAKPLASASLHIQGFYEVVLYTMSGTVKRGTFQNVDLSQPSVPLQTTPDETEHIAVQHIKAVYFMKPGDGPCLLPPAADARWKVVLHDGRRIEGQLSRPQESANGFFLIPRQEKSPTAYLYINRLAVQEMSNLTH